ncbi:Proteasome activator BLM10, partial [Kickxella alabastrina]
MMCSLTRVYPDFWRSVSFEQWKNPEFQENHFRYWGQHALIDDEKFALEWHVPSQPEISCAIELMHEIIVPHVKALNELLDQRSKSPGSSADNVRMNRLLMVLIYGVRSLGLLVMPPGTQIPASELGSAIIEGDECSNMPPRYLLDRQVAAGYIFAEGTPEYFEIVELREAISRVTARTLEFMAKSSEDDVENIKVLLFLAHSCMCHFGVDRITHSQVRRGWNFGLDNFSINNDACAMPRVFAVRRIMFEQSGRMLHNTRFSQASPLANEIAGLLAHFCLSQYAEVRAHAVSVLDNVMSILPALKYPLIPRFLAELSASESSDPERMSGALRILDTLPLRKACLRDWRFFPDLVLALCRAQHEDKPQVKKLVRSTAVSQVVHVSSPQPPHELSESIRELVLSLGGPDPDEAAVLRLKQEGQQNYLLASTENAQLVDSLVDILRNAGTTWRFAAIAGYYLERLTSVNTAPAPRVFATMADNLTSDIVLFRDSAALSLAQLLSRIRHRSKAESAFRTVEAPTPGPAYTDMCERALAGDEAALQAPFLDSPSAGWFAWPKKVKLYSPPPPGAPAAFENIDSESQDAYDAVRTIMFSKGKWDRITHLFSVESSRDPDHDPFGSSRASLYTQLFSLFGLPLLEHAWPTIEQLAQDIERTGAQ